MRNLAIGLVLLAALPAFAQEPAQQPAPADQQPAAAPPPAEPAPQAVTPAPTNPPMTGPQILISTSMGDITLQLGFGARAQDRRQSAALCAGEAL